MGYQALLFCPDEKNARIVTQVLSELDFAVETAHEPFAAVKKLMAQHFDALVVDCENEQNAGLLFRSARNSNANQSSLAVAVVEGQAGVAKAFRIGANLVLTKPINVEQSKGTLRVARGLLRKGSEPGKAASSHPAFSAELPSVPTSAAAKSGLAVPTATARLSAATSASLGSDNDRTGGQEGALGLLSSSPAKGLSPVPPALPSRGSAQAAPTQEGATSPTINPPFISTVSRSPSAAAAAAPARELPSSLMAAMEATSSAPKTEPELSFSYADTESGRTSSRIKIIVIAVAALLLVATAAYFGYKHGNNDEQGLAPKTPEAETARPQAVSVPSNQVPPQPAKPSAPVPPVNAARPAPPASKPSPTVKSSSPEPIAEDTTVTLEKVEPLKVKSDLSRPVSAKPAAAQPDQAAPPAPGALNINAANSDDKALSNIVAEAPAIVPKPVPQVLNISQGVTQGMVIKRVQPSYPQQALAMRIHGAVQLQATISKDGDITNVNVLSGEAILARAAVDAVRQWKYKPYYLNGEPVEIQTEITVNFKLPN